MLKNKTKAELLKEVEKLQRKLLSAQKKKDTTKTIKSTSAIEEKLWPEYFKNSLNTIIIIDKKGTIVDINRVVVASKKEIIGQSAFDFIHKDELSKFKKFLSKVFKTGKALSYQIKGLGPDGQMSEYSSRMIPLVKNKKVQFVFLDTTDITSELQVQERLKQSEVKYKKLSEAAFEGIVIHQNGKVVEVNVAITKIFGYTEKQVIGQPIFKFIDPSFHQTAIEKLSSKNEKVYEMLMLRKGNKSFWAELGAREIEYNGEPARVVAIRDITIQKEYEENLKSNEERFRMLAENAVDIISRYQVIPENKLEYISPSVKHITGYSPEEFYKDPDLGRKVIYPEDLQMLMKIVAAETERFEKGPPKPIIVRWIKKDGSIIWIETINRYLFNDQNQLMMIEAVGRDITDRKKLEIEKNIGEQALSQILNNIDELVYYIEFLPDGSRKVKYLSEHIEKVLGVKRDEYDLFANKFIEFVHPDELDKLKEKSKLIKTAKTAQHFVYRFMHQQKGEYIWLEEKVTPQFDEKGNHIGNFGITTDVTERIVAEQELKKSEERFRMLAENAMDVIYRYSVIPVPHYEYISPSIIKMSGYSPEEFYNDPYIAFKIIHPDDLHLLGDSERSLKEENKISHVKDPNVVLRWIRKDGSIIWTETKTQNVFNEKEEKIAVEGITRDVTEQVNSAESYKSLVDSSPDGVLIHIDGIIKFANPSALKMIGAKSLSDIMEKSALEFIDKEYHHQTLARIQRVKKGGDVQFTELKIRSLDGSSLIIETRPIAIKFNGLDAIQVVFHDISAQKQLLREQLRAQIAEETNQDLQQQIAERTKAESELKEVQKYIRLIIDSSIDMICASDKNGLITEFNKSALKTFGYTLDEIIGQSVTKLYAVPADRAKINDKEIFVNGTFSGEVLNRKKNGEIFLSYLSASVLKNEKGEIIGAMGVSRDISKEKESEKQLRDQSAKLNAVFESSSHVIWTINREYKITSFNSNFAKHMKLRYGVVAQLGLNMVEGDTVSSDEYNQFWIRKYDDVFKGKADYFETKLKDKFGELIWREIYLNPIFDNNGKVIEVSGIGHDITEKKIAEERIKQSLQEKEVLLKEVHHRVKNNLQVISSILNLQSSYVKDQGTLNILKESQNRIKSMAFIHESLYQTKDFSSINFSDYVVNLANNLMHSYSNFDHEIKLNLDIQNVFLNLDLAIPCGLIINEIVSNALKYAFVEKREGGVITIIMGTDGENLNLVIGDNGIGLPEEIDYRNTESLGLQLVVTLTDQLNGLIELDTRNGTRYKIVFNQNQAKNRI